MVICTYNLRITFLRHSFGSYVLWDSPTEKMECSDQIMQNDR